MSDLFDSLCEHGWLWSGPCVWCENERLRERVEELEMARDEYVAVKRGAAQNFVDAYSAASKYESETAEILWFQSAQAKVFDEFRRALAEIGGEDE